MAGFDESQNKNQSGAAIHRRGFLAFLASLPIVGQFVQRPSPNVWILNREIARAIGENAPDRLRITILKTGESRRVGDHYEYIEDQFTTWAADMNK